MTYNDTPGEIDLPSASWSYVPVCVPLPPKPNSDISVARMLALAFGDPTRRSRKRVDIEGRCWTALEVLADSDEFAELTESSMAWAQEARAESDRRVVRLLKTVKALIVLSTSTPSAGSTPHENETFAPALRRIAPLDSAPGAPPVSPSPRNPGEGLPAAA